MARGDYDSHELRRMGDAATREGADAYTVATDALRILPQLSEADLRTCAAFSVDPFTYLAAKLDQTNAIAAEREERARSAEFHEKYRRDQEEWGRAEIERLARL